MSIAKTALKKMIQFLGSLNGRCRLIHLISVEKTRSMFAPNVSMKNTLVKKVALVLFAVIHLPVNAEYIEAGVINGYYTLSTKHAANGFVFSAEKGERERIGIGAGGRQNTIEWNIGLNALESDVEMFGYIAYHFKTERALIDFGFTATDRKHELELAGTYLVSENWGYRVGFRRNELLFTFRRAW